MCVWALWRLQDAQRWTGSLKSFGYKVKWAKREMETKRREQERERERKGEEREQDNNIHKGRAESAKCGQQSLLLCDADSPVFMPTFQKEGWGGGRPENVYTQTQTWHFSSVFTLVCTWHSSSSKQYLKSGNQFVFFNTPSHSILTKRHSRFMWTRPRAPPHSPALVIFSVLQLQKLFHLLNGWNRTTCTVWFPQLVHISVLMGMTL